MNLSVAVYAALIRERTPFAQASYRDGEWACMLGRDGGNVNGEQYGPDLGGMLKATLLNPVGQWCVYWPGDAGADVRAEADAWLEMHQPAVSWIPDRPIGRANERGEAGPFFAACRTRRVVVVGPAHLAGLPYGLVGEAVHVLVPDAVAWKHVDAIAAGTLDMMQPDDLVLFAAGMASNLLIHALRPACPDATLFDIGSHLDPYCGVYSRAVFRDPAWQRSVMPRNFV